MMYFLSTGTGTLFALLGIVLIVYIAFAAGKSFFGNWLNEERCEHLNLRNMTDQSGQYRVTMAIRDPKGRYTAIVKRKRSFWYTKVVHASSRERLETEIDNAYRELHTDWLLKRW